MARINLLTPSIVRARKTDILPISFTIQLSPKDTATSATFTIETSDTEDFSTITTITPTSYKYTKSGNTNTATGNTISNTNFDAQITYEMAALSVETVKYARVSLTIGSTTLKSQPIMFITLMKLDFSLKNPIPFTTRPNKVLVNATIESSNPTGYTLKVQACNNAFDTNPTWEDVTQAFNEKRFHTFANTNKEQNKSWGISVRFIITKSNYLDSVEVLEVVLGFV